jgi:hypothetical protein
MGISARRLTVITSSPSRNAEGTQLDQKSCSRENGMGSSALELAQFDAQQTKARPAGRSNTYLHSSKKQFGTNLHVLLNYIGYIMLDWSISHNRMLITLARNDEPNREKTSTSTLFGQSRGTDIRLFGESTSSRRRVPQERPMEHDCGDERFEWLGYEFCVIWMPDFTRTPFLRKTCSWHI